MENNQGRILPVDISSEMKKCYMEYSMSVIVGRALPDIRDGLKPVHRRILYSMHSLSLYPDKPYRKSAKIVGDVLANFHPHGDASVYYALVRMAQDFSMRSPLVNGHGNFGSIDGDSAAAMRYTEAKMNKITVEMIRDINKETVDFMDNYDGSEKEPVVLPSRFPNLLVNGSSGIAVGMATNIPPHNLGEVIDGVVHIIENGFENTTTNDLMNYIKGPDFPLGGVILGNIGIREAYEKGRGKIVVRSKVLIEEINNKNNIIVTELPYQVNKSRLIEHIAELIRDKKIVGISDLRDESDREGIRIVIELKKDANSNVLLNQLYKLTKLQDSFGVIMLALVDNEPKVLNLKESLNYYLLHQKDVVTRRTKYDLNKAEQRKHILEGYKIALDNIDEIIKIIKSSKTIEIARDTLIEKFNFSEIQANSILEMRLRRLTALERDKIDEELREKIELINKLQEILNDEHVLLNLIKEELIEIKEKYGDERRTQIDLLTSEGDVNKDDLIQKEDIVITLTHDGYIKRMASNTYSSQRRGGRGMQAMSVKENDFIKKIFHTTTHHNLLFFTNLGRVYSIKAYEIPDASRVARGINIVNLIQINSDEKVQAVLCLENLNEEGYILMATKFGLIKKTAISEFSKIRKSGLIAIGIRDKDELLNVKQTRGDANIVMITSDGYAIIFNEKNIRAMGRSASGVKAITLRSGDSLIALDIATQGEDLMIVSENGYGKRTDLKQYPIQNRGGKGIKTYKVTEKTGKVSCASVVNQNNDIMLVNSNGVGIRIKTEDISRIGRSSLGVKLMKTNVSEKVIAVGKIKD